MLDFGLTLFSSSSMKTDGDACAFYSCTRRASSRPPSKMYANTYAKNTNRTSSTTIKAEFYQGPPSREPYFKGSAVSVCRFGDPGHRASLAHSLSSTFSVCAWQSQRCAPGSCLIRIL